MAGPLNDSCEYAGVPRLQCWRPSAGSDGHPSPFPSAQPRPDPGLAAPPSAHLVGRYIRLQQLVFLQQVVHRGQVFAVILGCQEGLHLAAEPKRKASAQCTRRVLEHPARPAAIPSRLGGWARLIMWHCCYRSRPSVLPLCRPATQAPGNLNATAKGRVIEPSRWWIAEHRAMPRSRTRCQGKNWQRGQRRPTGLFAAAQRGAPTTRRPECPTVKDWSWDGTTNATRTCADIRMIGRGIW